MQPQQGERADSASSSLAQALRVYSQPQEAPKRNARTRHADMATYDRMAARMALAT